MAKFEVKIVRVEDVFSHPNADRLSLVKIGGFSVISAKLDDGTSRYKSGDLVVYVPENALVPEYLLKKGFWDETKGKGILSGTLGNRVKPIRLRGILSEGILFPVNKVDDTNDYSIDGLTVIDDKETVTTKIVTEGEDVTEFLQIKKWEPEVPSNMSGDLFPETGTIKYDFENIKKVPTMFIEGEQVYFTEKLHGTFCQIGMYPKFTDEHLFNDKYFVTSKGLGSKNLAFKKTEENKKNNLYVQTFLENAEKFRNLETYFSNSDKVIFFGEIFGKGIQDLNYDLPFPEFRIFDIWVDGVYLGLNELTRVTEAVQLEMVPLVYIGPYSEEIVKKYTTGQTLINNAHIREGIVMKPVEERNLYNGDRVIAKSISEEYLTRKGNQTEFQ